jgi:cell division protein FtsQ
MIVDTAPLSRRSPSSASPKTPAASAATASKQTGAPLLWRHIVLAAILAAAVIGLLLAYRTVDQFLIRDARFTLTPPADPAFQAGPTLTLEGLKHTPRAAVLRLFEEDYGRSVYLAPLNERRRDLLGIKWVRSATISRVWPNQLVVRIEERKPVAYARLERGLRLIDEDGEFLERPETAGFTLPILDGVTPGQSAPERQLRISRALRLLAEAGESASEISEINAADPGNLKVIHPYGPGQAVTLILGAENFAARLRNFHANADQLRAQCPSARVLDLRSSTIIIAQTAEAPTEGDPPCGPR